MNITVGNRGMLMIDDARIVYRNFSGVGSQYNREGDRNFSIIIPNQDMADELLSDGWNVKIKPPREDGEEPFMTLPVKVKFNNRGPKAYLMTNGRQTPLDETTIDCLDDVDIVRVDLDVRPFDWSVNGKEGRTAYLQSIQVTQEVDRFASRFREDEDY